MNQNIISIARFFSPQKIITASSFGNGNINDTYLITDTRQQFILQRLNTTVFTQPHFIFANQLQLEQLLEKQPENNVPIHIPRLIPAQNGHSHYKDQQNHYWRAQEFIQNSHETKQLSSQQAESVGQLLGHCHNLCSEQEASTFHQILPNLHATTKHINNYNNLRHIPDHTPLDICNFCRNYIASQQQKALDLDQQLQEPTLPKRLIHGDPKLANILFNNITCQASTLIDLDTIGAGMIHHDLSDLIRSCCNAAKEDSPRQTVSFKLEFAKKIISGYSNVMAPFLTQAEIDLLGKTLWLIPFELGIRFINDYLSGSVYFKTLSPHHNLNRGCNQFKLAIQIQQHQPELEAHIHTCFT